MASTAMTETHLIGDRRAQHAALLGFALQLGSFILLLALSWWKDSYLLAALARLLLAGVPIWLVLYLVLSQLRRVALEALETQELRRAQETGASQAIFEVDEEGLLLEQNRLRWLVRWVLPGCTIGVTFYLLGGHFFFWGWDLKQAFDQQVLRRTNDPTLMMWFIVGAGFLCFLYARYALALARIPGWQLLRAGAVHLAGGAAGCVLAAVALMAAATFSWAEPLAAYLIRIGLIILGLELAINFVLDLYRPRVAGELSRPSFDSRLLGMLAEPGSIAKSIAEALNYQFGFQVSSTWFYQLLQRWLFPIVVASVAAVLALSSIVVIDADEEAIVERFGRVAEDRASLLTPGVHFKLPFPIDIVHRAPVERIRELVIGEASQGEDEHAHDVVIWTEKHEFVPELLLLVASPRLEEESTQTEQPVQVEVAEEGGESVAVSLLMVSVPIEYRVKDLRKYLYTYAEPEKLLEEIAYQRLSDFAASVDIDQLMGPGRETFNRELKGRLQARLDELDSGIEILFAGIRGAHPPAKQKVAAAFQSVISAQTGMAATIHAAEGHARKILTTVAGTETRALAVDEAIRTRDALPPQAPALPEANERVEHLLIGDPVSGLPPISGDAAARIAEAKAKASEQISLAAAKALAFETQVAAFRAAPSLYMHRKRLESYQQLDNIRKFLIVGDPSNVIVEYETAKEAGLDQVLTEGVAKERKRTNP